MTPLRIGLVGFGWFGRKHYAAWRHVPNVKVVAVADRNLAAILAEPTSASQTSFHTADQDSYDMDVAGYATLQEMLCAEKLDLIDVVVDEANHYAVAKEALQAGLSVIVEKPFVTRYDDACELASVALAKRLHVYAGHLLRFDNRILMIQDMITKGEIGDIKYMSFKRNFQAKAHSVYGRTHPFFSALVHDIDLSLLFAKQKVTKVTAETRFLLGHDTPDVLIGALSFGSHLLCTVENVWHVSPGCPYGFENEFTLYGCKSTVIQRNVPVVEIWDGRRAECPDLFFWPTLHGETQGALRSMLEHYADCYRKGKDSDIVPMADVVECMRVADMLITASKVE